MPSRIRYNQFFFYAGFAYFIYTVHSRNWMLVDESEKDLGKRKYYTTGRAYQNMLMRSNDQATLKSHVKKQTFIL